MTSNNWKKVSIRDLLGSAEAGVSVNGCDKICGKDEFGVLKVSAVSGGTFDPSEVKCIKDDEIHRAKINPKKNHIVFSRANTPELVGASAYISKTYPNLYLSDKLWLLSPKDTEIVNMRWLAFLLGSPFMRNKIGQLATGTSSSMKNISKEALLGLEITLPSLNQQKAIADILSTWDEAIEKTERLISLKEEYFRLLTNQIFLKNPEIMNWNCSTLNKLVKVKKGEQLNRTELEKEGIYPAWNGGIKPSGYTDIWNTEENTVTISEGGNSCGFVNYSKKKFWCGGHCYSLMNLKDKISSEFLYLYLKAQEKRIMRLRVGSGLPNIQKGEIEKIEIAYPNLEEQNTISHNLNIVLNEIMLMRQILNLYRRQKQGLMQKLLTGKWRVNFKEEK